MRETITRLSDMVDRDLELAVLRARLEEARAGRPSVVLVGGDAGIGKTRLLAELRPDSADHVLWGGCLPLGNRGLPYLAIIEMLRTVDQGVIDGLPAALETLIPTLDTASSGRSVSRSHLFQTVVQLFESVAADRPLLVVVEDLHWADTSTLDLLDFLFVLLREQRILVVATYRADDLRADHPLNPLLTEWSRRANVHRIDLEPLSSEDSLRLLVNRLPPVVGRDAVMRLVERAGGNPYFLEELAAAGATAAEMPGPLREFLLHRADGLPGDVLRLLRIASVGGTVIYEELAGEVAGLDVDDTRNLLRAARDARLVVIDGGVCRFRHALLAEVLHDDLLPAERREFHGAYADLLAARSPSAPAAELAAHQAEAGRVEDALAAWSRAAEAAEEQFAFAEARQSYQAALDLWHQVGDPETRTGISHIDLQRRLAETAFLAGDYEFACEVTRGILLQIDPTVDPITTGLVNHRLARYLCDTPRHGEGLEIQRRAVDLIPATPPSPERAEVVAGLASILQYAGRYHEAHDAADEAIDLAVETGASHAEILGRNILGNVTCMIEDVDLGLGIIRHALDLARRVGDALEQTNAHWNLWANLFQAARWEDTVAAYADLETVLPRLGQAHQLPTVMVGTADALMRLGRWEEADRLIDRARSMDPAMGDVLGLAELLTARKRFIEARSLVAAKAEQATAADSELHLWNLVNLAEIEAAEGLYAEAMANVELVLERSTGLYQPLAVGYAIAAGIRAAANLARTARVKGDELAREEAVRIGRLFHHRIYELLERPGPIDGWKREVGALGAQADAELTRLESRPDPTVWLHAVDRWTGLSMPYHAAYCRFRSVEAALESGVSREQVTPVVVELVAFLSTLGATLLAEEVRRLARRARIDLGEGSPPDRYGMTDREREVLAQLARGGTNRQIAEILFISEKTASVHVSNILRKLSASNRGEAAATAMREGLVEIADLRV